MEENSWFETSFKFSTIFQYFIIDIYYVHLFFIFEMYFRERESTNSSINTVPTWMDTGRIYFYFFNLIFSGLKKILNAVNDF